MNINLRKQTVKLFALALLVAFMATFISPVPALAASNNALKLVAVRDHITGSFTTSQSVYANQFFLYMGSAQGDLFVLKRSRNENFPLIQTIHLGAPITAVRGYDSKLFVTTSDGYLRQYLTSNPLTLQNMVQLSTYGLSSMAIFNHKVYVGKGQSSLAVDNNYLYLAELNEGDTAMELNAQLAVVRTFGQSFEPEATILYNRLTGNRVGDVANPTTLLNQTGFPSLFAFGGNLFQTVPGCCGAGVVITPSSALFTNMVAWRSYANAVTMTPKGMVVGDEAGNVSLYKLNRNTVRILKTLNLPLITEHFGSEDIEIRSVWSDGYDNLVFCGSSWGNPTSQTPFLPSLFVFEVN